MQKHIVKREGSISCSTSSHQIISHTSPATVLQAKQCSSAAAGGKTCVQSRGKRRRLSCGRRRDAAHADSAGGIPLQHLHHHHFHHHHFHHHHHRHHHHHHHRRTHSDAAIASARYSACSVLNDSSAWPWLCRGRVRFRGLGFRALQDKNQAGCSMRVWGKGGEV